MGSTRSDLRMDGIEVTTILTTVLGVFSTVGVTFIAKDYIASLLGGLMMRKDARIKPGTRVKIMVTPSLKGDIEKVGWVRSSLMEVGEGDRFPSVRTGRMLIVPNSILMNSPMMIYGEEVVDEVIVHIDSDFPDPEAAIQCMKDAMVEAGVKVKDVNISHKTDSLVVYGFYKADPDSMSDRRSEITSLFLKKFSMIRGTPPAT